MKTFAQVGLLVALCAASAPTSQARLITFNFTGTVTHVNIGRCPNLANDVREGDKLSGSYTFESATTGIPNPVEDPGVRYPAITAGEFTLVGTREDGTPGRTFSSSVPTGGDCWGIRVSDNYIPNNSSDPPQVYDIYEVYLDGLGAGYPDGAEAISLNLRDSNCGMLVKNDLPTTPPTLPEESLYSGSWFSIDFGPEDSVVGKIDSLTVVHSDSTPPIVQSVVADPDRLWPANGKLVPVTVAAAIMDDDSGVASATLIIDDEYNQFDGEVPMVFDAASGLWAATIPLRALRLPFDFFNGGRRYALTVRATYDAGNQLWLTNQQIRFHHFLGHEYLRCGGRLPKSVQPGLVPRRHQHPHLRLILFQRSPVDELSPAFLSPTLPMSLVIIPPCPDIFTATGKAGGIGNACVCLAGN